MNPRLKDIIAAIEEQASPSLQEEWDNTGWQLAPYGEDAECGAVMLCLDVTPGVVAEAMARGCNLIISHHPLLFRGLKSITGSNNVQRMVIECLRNGISVYSSHTALDSASAVGISRRLGRLLGLNSVRVLSPHPGRDDEGLGIVGRFDQPISHDDFVALVKKVYGAPMVRITAGPAGADAEIRSVALCSGSGGEFIPAAIAAGADAYISSDIRYHDFLDYGLSILIVDTGHFESEICSRMIFREIIADRYPDLPVFVSSAESNPVRYV